MDAAIYIKDFHWRYPTFTEKRSLFALRGVTMVVRQNETLGIVGRNGSGKSTLCSAIAGIIPYQAHLTEQDGPEFMSGEIRVFGKIVSSVTEVGGKKLFICNDVASPTVGVVMQDPESQFISASLKEELYLGLRFMGISGKQAEARVKRALEVVGLYDLYPYLNEIHPSELSGGQKQRLIIASFIAMAPRILVLDEPTSDLDPVGKFEVMDAINRIKTKLKLTLIIVEQDPEVMYRIADRLIVLANGRIRATGTPLSIYSKRSLCKKLFISRPALFDIADTAKVPPADSVGALTKKIKPSEWKMAYKKITKHSQSKLIVIAEDLQFAYNDGVAALDHVSLQIMSGEFIALIGQNGSGKTTLAQVISGIEPASGGKVSVAGLDLRNAINRRGVHKHVGYIFQNPDHQLFTRSVHDEVEYGLIGSGISTSDIHRLTTKCLRNVGLLRKSMEDPIFLSKSEKRKLALASILILKPEIIVADEVLMGQDKPTSEQILSMLRRYSRAGGSVVLITHDMQLVAKYCSRTIAMKDGKIVYDGDTKTFFNDKKLLKLVSLKAPTGVLVEEMLKKVRACSCQS